MYCSILHKPCKQKAHAYIHKHMHAMPHTLYECLAQKYVHMAVTAVQLARDRLTLTTRREVGWDFLVCCDILITTCGAEWII